MPNQWTGPRPVADRFFEKVAKTSEGCWDWTGSKTPEGYGRIKINRIPQPAYRVGYELMVGPIPSGLQLDHLCRNPRCVNPEHLEPVTNRENALRGFGLGGVNARKTHCINGHEFTEENTHLAHSSGRLPARRCRTCDRNRHRLYYHNRKATA